MTLDGAALRSIVAGDGPAVPERVPVAITSDHVDAGRNRVQDLLAVAPLPLDRAEIPNGAIRAELTAAAAAAREDLEAAASAPSPFEALATLRSARVHAGQVAGGWRYVEEGLRREDLRGAATRLEEDVAAFRGERDYVGAPGEAVRAVLVHASVEALVGTAAGRATLGDGDGPYEWRSNPVSVGGLVGDLERGRGALADAQHVYGRYLESLDAERSLRPRFVAAGAGLLDEAGRRTDDLPGSDADPAEAVEGLSEGSPGWNALKGLLNDLHSRRPLIESRRDGDVAPVVVRSHRRLARVGGAEALLAGLREGTRFTPEAAEDVRAIREAALAAIDSAVQDTSHPELAREVTADLAGYVRYADHELARVGEEVPASHLARDLAEYVRVRYVARALPAAGAAVVDAL